MPALLDHHVNAFAHLNDVELLLIANALTASLNTVDDADEEECIRDMIRALEFVEQRP